MTSTCAKTWATAIAILAASTTFQAKAAPTVGISYFSLPTTKSAGLAFSDAVRAGDTLYLNNQIGNIPGNGKLVANNFDSQFQQVLQNIDTVLSANRLSRSDIVMCTVTLTDMAAWGELNRLWKESFAPDQLPARNVIGTTALPLGALVGVQCIAHYPASGRHATP